MNQRKSAALLLIAFFISALPEVLPNLLIKIQGSSHIRFIGSLAPFKSPCSTSFSDVACRVEYNIPVDSLGGTSALESKTLGLGNFLTDFAVKCDDRLVYQPPSKTTPKLLLESYKIYKTIDLSTLHCDNAKTLTIFALSPAEFPTSGQISMNAVIGERDYVSSIKRNVEFLNVGVYFVFSLILLFSVFEMRVLLKALLRLSDQTTWFLAYMPIPWAIFSAFKAGVFDTLFSIPSSIFFLFRFQTGLSLLCHSQALLFSEDRLRLSKRIRKGLLAFLLAAYVPFALLPSFNLFLAYSVLVLAVLRLITGPFFKEPNWFLLAFSVAALAEALKAFDVKWIPSGSITIAFIVVAQLMRSTEQKRSAGILASVNVWSRRALENVTNDPNIYKLLETFGNEVDVDQVSFTEIDAAGNHEVYVFDKNDPSECRANPVAQNSVPIGISYVLTTGNTLLHERADDHKTFYGRFKRDPNPKYGNFYSMAIVEHSKKVLGVLSFTKYRFDPTRQQTAPSRT